MLLPIRRPFRLLRELWINPLLRRELQRLARGAWRTVPGGLVILLWLANLIYMLVALKAADDISIDTEPEFSHVCYWFGGFHLYLHFFPVLLLFFFRQFPYREAGVDELRLTRLSTRERVLGWIAPRYLLALFILLCFYFSFWYWQRWLWTMTFNLSGEPVRITTGEAGTPGSFNEFFTEALPRGNVALWFWHPLVTLSYFSVTLLFTFCAALYFHCRTRTAPVALGLSLLFTLGLEIALYIPSMIWHGDWPPSVNDVLELLEWPMILYGLLMHYVMLSGPLVLILKLWLARRFWRAALRRLEAGDEPAF